MQAREMTDATMSLRKIFCATLSSCLTEACTSPWQITGLDEPAGKPESAANGCFRFRFEGSLQGSAFLVFSLALPEQLGLRDAGAGSDHAAHTAALFKAFQACALRLGESLTNFGTVLVEAESAEELELQEGLVFNLSAESGAADPLSRHTMHLRLNDDLAASLQPAAAKRFLFPEAAGGSESANLDLVMDVELNVTLRFGERQMALREVLELTSGSVVELDRLVDEPVELILDGRVVARGEAVIVDGNYGMRITEVLQQVVT